ncbi:GNAT family N-acetyltransferase [Cognatilysobacter terrigena]|uniref:GNAT family N-acetyltransferase n=1 Tax=Cognatilysobacter terrigena TaxID=2488749 RepID=UPI001061AE43|nr:GNAT family N-acetyltransferase [Lysobacter terrigena]
MLGHLRVRDAVPTDAELLAQWACTMAMETEHLELDPNIVLAGVTQGIADPSKAHYIVAVREVPVAGSEVIAEPVGMLMTTTEWSDWRCGHWWWIQSVYVAPARRRAGVFRALYDHVRANAAARRDVIGLRLYVERDNDVAQSTYTSLGMRDAGYRIFEATTRSDAR